MVHPSAKPKADGQTALSPLEEQLHRIEVLAKKIDGYIQYICKMAGQSGISSEAKTRAATVFYEKLIVAEQQLGRVHDDLQLE